MPYSPILAHGALGALDEVIFFAIAAIFLIMMGISWFSSRRRPHAPPSNTPADTEPTTVQPQADHVPLE
jgi:hypothetical protein